MKSVCLLTAGSLLCVVAAIGEETKEAQEPEVVQKERFAAEDTDPGDEVDPFAPAGYGYSMAPRIPARRGAEKRVTLRVRLETWEMDAKEVAQELDGLDGPEGIGNRRNELLEDTDSVLVFSPVVTVEEKSKATCEAILERIYPTEYEGGGLGSEEKASPKPDKLSPIERFIASVGSQALPTAFETRNTGRTVEIEVQPVAAESGTWDLSVSLEEVRQVGIENYGAKELILRMPAFATFRTGGLLRIEEGKWQLFSVQEPPRGLDGKPTGKRWVTIVRVDRAR